MGTDISIKGKSKLRGAKGYLSIANFIKGGLIVLLKVYQDCFSLLFLPCCRFFPSCSVYMQEALLRKGLIKGLKMGLLRLLRCHPLHPGGYDPVRR